MKKERKQVLTATAKLSSLVKVTDAPTPVIAGSLHGLVKDLTVNGTGH